MFLKFTLSYTKHLYYRNLLRKTYVNTFDKVNNVFRAPLSLKLKKERKNVRNVRNKALLETVI